MLKVREINGNDPLLMAFQYHIVWCCFWKARSNYWKATIPIRKKHLGLANITQSSERLKRSLAFTLPFIPSEPPLPDATCCVRKFLSWDGARPHFHNFFQLKNIQCVFYFSSDHLVRSGKAQQQLFSTLRIYAFSQQFIGDCFNIDLYSHSFKFFLLFCFSNLSFIARRKKILQDWHKFICNVKFWGISSWRHFRAVANLVNAINL